MALWDAESIAPASRPRTQLIAELEKDGEWRIAASGAADLTASDEQVVPAESVPVIPDLRKLRPSIITSISPGASDSALSLMRRFFRRGKSIPVDLFCFMSRERLPTVGGRQQLSPLFALANGWDNVHWLDECATRIHRACNATSASNLPAATVQAVASFVPGFVPGMFGFKQDAIRSLASIWEIAFRLRTEYTHPVRAVEMVCGTSIQHIYRFLNSDEKQDDVFAQIVSGDDAAACVAKGCQSLVELLQSRHSTQDLRTLPFVIEVEPGP
jgi:hypothetical protein